MGVAVAEGEVFGGVGAGEVAGSVGVGEAAGGGEVCRSVPPPGATVDAEGDGLGGASLAEVLVPGSWRVTARTATATVTTDRAVPATRARLLQPGPAVYIPRSRGRDAGLTAVSGSSSRARARASRTTGRVSRSREFLRSSPCTVWASGPARTGV
uniref:hypothetical protein n=1 Tax=Streptomyces resistomycificus TaxID=67356 RepID=UPI00384E68F9